MKQNRFMLWENCFFLAYLLSYFLYWIFGAIGNQSLTVWRNNFFNLLEVKFIIELIFIIWLTMYMVLIADNTCQFTFTLTRNKKKHRINIAFVCYLIILFSSVYQDDYFGPILIDIINKHTDYIIIPEIGTIRLIYDVTLIVILILPVLMTRISYLEQQGIGLNKISLYDILFFVERSD